MPDLKIGKGPEYTFLQTLTDGQQVCENVLNITIREMQDKTIMRYHLIYVEMTMIKI